MPVATVVVPHAPNNAGAMDRLERFAAGTALTGLPARRHQLRRRLRAQPWAQQAVIVAFSGGRGDKMPSAVMEAGFDHFCPKPYRPEYLELWGAPRSGSG